MEPRVNEFERALARRLWEAGVLEGPLRALLAEVEGPADLSLAAAVVTRGLTSVELVERLPTWSLDRPGRSDPR